MILNFTWGVLVSRIALTADRIDLIEEKKLHPSPVTNIADMRTATCRPI